MGNNIKLSKLVSGEVVVGYLNDETDILENCLALQAMPAPDGHGIQMGISPYMAPYSPEKSNIEKQYRIVTINADPQLAAQYQQITTGIVTATPGDLKNIVGFPGPRKHK